MRAMLRHIRTSGRAIPASRVIPDTRPAASAQAESIPWYVGLIRHRDFVPLALLVGCLFVSLALVFTQARKYGITLDEPLQENFGKCIFQWYRTLGKDASCLNSFPPREYMREHGGIFDAGVVAVQHVFKHSNPWLVRHTVTGLVGWLGIVGIALCGYALGGAWVAFAAALGVLLFPRYYGAMFNNPKDVPAAAALTFVLWATLLLVKHWQRRRLALGLSALLGGFLGIATAIRVPSLSWLAVLVVILVIWWLLNGPTVWRERQLIEELIPQLAAAAIIGITTLLTTMLLWPYVFVDPIAHLFQAIRVLSHYPWNGYVLFNGHEYPASQLPLSYVPTWLEIGSPLLLLPLATLAIVIIVVETIRHRHVDPLCWIGIAAFVLPLAPLLLLHPVLYDALRQFLYVFPPLILLAAYGVTRGAELLASLRFAAGRWLAVVLVAVTVISYAQVAAEMVALSPYEYVYFSPLVGGLRGASAAYETDYYGACAKAAADWLAANYRRYTTAPSPTFDAAPGLSTLTTPYLPGTFHLTSAQPYFYIGFTNYEPGQTYSTYPVIDTVAAEGVPLCMVKVNPSAAWSRGGLKEVSFQQVRPRHRRRTSPALDGRIPCE
jgi:hypothetical protein